MCFCCYKMNFSLKCDESETIKPKLLLKSLFKSHLYFGTLSRSKQERSV